MFKIVYHVLRRRGKCKGYGLSKVGKGDIQTSLVGWVGKETYVADQHELGMDWTGILVCTKCNCPDKQSFFFFLSFLKYLLNTLSRVVHNFLCGVKNKPRERSTLLCFLQEG